MKLCLLVITVILSLPESPRGSEQPELVLKSGAVVNIGDNYRDTCGGGQLEHCPDPPVLRRGKTESAGEFYYRTGQYFFKKKQTAHYVNYFDLARRNGAPRDSSLYFMAEGLFQQRQYTLALNINYRQQLETTRLKESILIQRARFLKFLGLEKEADAVYDQILTISSGSIPEKGGAGGFDLSAFFKTVMNEVAFSQESIELDPGDIKKQLSEVDTDENGYLFNQGLTHYLGVSLSGNSVKSGRWRFLQETSVWRRQNKKSGYRYGGLESTSWQPLFQLEYLAGKTGAVSHFVSGNLSYTHWDSDWEELNFGGNYYASVPGKKAYASWFSSLDFQKSSLESWSGYTAFSSISGTVLPGARFRLALAVNITYRKFPTEKERETGARILYCDGIQPGMILGSDDVACYEGPDYAKRVTADPFTGEFDYPYAYDSSFQLKTITPRTFWQPGLTLSALYQPASKWQLHASVNSSVRQYPETFNWHHAPVSHNGGRYFRYDRSGENWYYMTGRQSLTLDRFYPLFGSMNRQDVEWRGSFSITWQPAGATRVRLAYSGTSHGSNMETNPNVYSRYRSGVWSLHLEQKLVTRGRN